LWQTVYDELRRIAGEKMSRENRQVTLQATVLVHEAWIRLAGSDASPQTWNGRTHFFSAAAEAMRRILVDQARRRLSQKRGGREEHVGMENAATVAARDDEKLLQVHEVLDALAQENAQQAQISPAGLEVPAPGPAGAARRFARMTVSVLP
jgi:RNA polymerase sigma factor (TIGR02999 family)